ncbi:MAG: HAD-IA family hydrolase [Candidatus Omnitrophota bacterium]
MNTEVIFFDFDGVIVESLNIKRDAFARLFEDEGERIVKEVVDYHLAHEGVSRYEKFIYIYKEMLKRPLDEDTFRDLSRKFSDLVMEDVVLCPYVKGAREFLEQYSEKYKCFVLSATPKDEIREIVRRRKLNGFFQGVYGAPDEKTDMVRSIIKKEGIEPARAVYIGDAISDYRAAQENAARFIAKINDNGSIFAGIDCVKVKDLKNLKQILET